MHVRDGPLGDLRVAPRGPRADDGVGDTREHVNAGFTWVTPGPTDGAQFATPRRNPRDALRAGVGTAPPVVFEPVGQVRRDEHRLARFTHVHHHRLRAAEPGLEPHGSRRERRAVRAARVPHGEHGAVFQAVDDAPVLERDVKGLDHPEERGVRGRVVPSPGGHARLVDVRSAQVEAHFLVRLG